MGWVGVGPVRVLDTFGPPGWFKRKSERQTQLGWCGTSTESPLFRGLVWGKCQTSPRSEVPTQRVPDKTGRSVRVRGILLLLPLTSLPPYLPTSDLSTSDLPTSYFPTSDLPTSLPPTSLPPTSLPSYLRPPYL